MLLLLPQLPILRAHAPHLQDRQPDLVVAPGDGARAPGARDPTVRLTLKPVWQDGYSQIFRLYVFGP